MTMCQRLFSHLPENFVGAPTVHLGRGVEIDVAAFNESPDGNVPPASSGGVATAVYAPARPTFVAETDLVSPEAYEVRIYDPSRDRVLVAAVEIVSPSNKDRPETRADFVGKCLHLLRSGVCVSVVDVVTSYHFNLFADLYALLNHRDPTFAENPPHLYACTLRYAKRDGVGYLESWSLPLALGEALPTLPVWLSPTLAVPLELEASYEDVCRVLRIR